MKCQDFNAVGLSLVFFVDCLCLRHLTEARDKDLRSLWSNSGVDQDLQVIDVDKIFNDHLAVISGLLDIFIFACIQLSFCLIFFVTA